MSNLPPSFLLVPWCQSAEVDTDTHDVVWVGEHPHRQGELHFRMFAIVHPCSLDFGHNFVDVREREVEGKALHLPSSRDHFQIRKVVSVGQQLFPQLHIL